MIRHRLLLLLLPVLLGAPLQLAAQRVYRIAQADTTVFLDFLVDPASVEVAGAVAWRFEPGPGLLHLRVVPPAVVRIQYRPPPFPLLPRLGPPPATDTLSGLPVLNRPDPPAFADATRLTRSGSLTRGVRVGSGRDLSVESGLRFQAEGQLTDDIRLSASLTDRNLPVQPDGTTQALRDFDEVYIRAEHRAGRLQMGDLDISLPEGTFGRFQRRLQGAELRTDTRHGRYLAGVAMVRGTFRRQAITLQNGVSGPYRLTGASGEPFVTVLAGTERVFRNGERLVRGEDRDYVMDYDLGEITFVSTRLLQPEDRIVVEYQFLDTRYPRTWLAAEARPAPAFGIRYLRQADGIRAAEAWGLTDAERRALSRAGDGPATVDGADSTGFRPGTGEVRYVRADTTVAGETYTIYRFRPGDPAAVWRVAFTPTGAGGGAYRLRPDVANGAVYEWVGPGRGDHEPLRVLVAPQDHHLLTGDAVVRLGAFRWRQEAAISLLDLNRFSPLDDTDNLGTAWESAVVSDTLETAFGRIQARFTHRHIGAEARFFEDPRDVEHAVRWALPAGSTGDDWLNEGAISILPTSHSRIAVSAGRLARGGASRTRMELDADTREPGLPFASSLWSHTRAADAQATFGRSEVGWRRQTGAFALTPGVGLRLEDRRDARPVNGLPDLRSGFIEWTPGVAWETGRIWAGHLQRLIRSEPHAGSKTVGWEGGSRLTTDRIQHQSQIGWAARTDSSGIRSESVRFRSDLTARTRDRWMEVGWVAGLRSESRALQAETYLDVGSELGQFVWEDLNSDGVQQIDEFFPEQSPDEGVYILRFRPVEDRTPTRRGEHDWRWELDPGRRWRDAAWAANIRYRGRHEREREVQADTLLVRSRNRWLHEWDLLRRVPGWDVRIVHDRSRSRIARFLGPEAARQQVWTLAGSYAFERRVAVGLDATHRTRNVTSADAPFRNSDIDAWTLAPHLRLWWNATWQSGLRTTFGRGTDRDGALIRVDSRRVRADLTRSGRASNLFLQVEFRQTDFRGTPDPYVEFELSEGAGRGMTWAWSLRGDWRLSEFLRADVSYDARTRTAAEPIHILTARIIAVF